MELYNGSDGTEQLWCVMLVYRTQSGHDLIRDSNTTWRRERLRAVQTMHVSAPACALQCGWPVATPRATVGPMYSSNKSTTNSPQIEPVEFESARIRMDRDK